jgi:outer membrane lipoprotein-sorting protein
MRALTPVLAVALLSSTLVGRADDPDPAKDLLAKAVNAIGGPEKAAAFREMTLKGKGRYIFDESNAFDFTFDVSIKDADKLRFDAKFNVGGNEIQLVIIINGDKAYAGEGTLPRIREVGKNEASTFKSVILALLASGNPATIADRKELTLAHGGEATLATNAAAILRLGRKDQSDILIYFDKQTGLPLKSETQTKDGNGQETSRGFEFSDFKDEDGVKHFSKVKFTHDGKTRTEIEVTEIKTGAKIDPSTFEKP